MGFNGIYHLVNIQKALENSLFIVDLPMEDGDVPWQTVSLPECN